MSHVFEIKPPEAPTFAIHELVFSARGVTGGEAELLEGLKVKNKDSNKQVRKQLEITAEFLAGRQVEGEPVTADWLWRHLTYVEIEQLYTELSKMINAELN